MMSQTGNSDNTIYDLKVRSVAMMCAKTANRKPTRSVKASQQRIDICGRCGSRKTKIEGVYYCLSCGADAHHIPMRVTY